MATKVVMEALSPTMEEGRLVKWLKGEGDAVKSGDVLAEVETDKAVMELVARADGVLRKRLVNEGDATPVGQLIGVIAGADENIDALVGGAGGAGRTASGTPTARDQRVDVLVRRRDDAHQLADRRRGALADEALAQHTVAARDELHHRLVGLDLGEDVALLHRVALVEDALAQHALDPGEELHHGLVGLDLGEHVTDRDRLTLLLLPFDEAALLHRGGERLHDDFSSHVSFRSDDCCLATQSRYNT